MIAADNSTSGDKGLRIRVFATFFKSYMSVSTIVAASIPIPVTSLKLIPIYTQQKSFLTVYTSLFCFLLLAFVFSIRHRLAPAMFSRTRTGAFIAMIPLLCMALTLTCILLYHETLQLSFEVTRAHGGVNASTQDLLEQSDFSEIPYSLPLAACYLGIFIFAESAFVMMAIREYLQDILHLNEVSLLQGAACIGSTTGGESESHNVV